MKLLADLHTHTTASDGQYTPAQLVERAQKRGLDVLAVTDHDTIDGLGEAARAGVDSGIRVLNGIELGAKEHKNLHILGYQFSRSAPTLNALCRDMKASRDERKYRILDFLAEKGICLELAEVEELAGGAVIARPHFAQVMVRRGYVKDNREAFDRYLDTEEYQRIERVKPSAETCIQTIKESGGLVSLAHPYQLGFEDARLEETVKTLKGYGLDAIECRYPRHTPQQTRFYLELARKYGLFITGGSDFHGERVKPDIELAAVELELDWLLDQ